MEAVVKHTSLQMVEDKPYEDVGAQHVAKIFRAPEIRVLLRNTVQSKRPIAAPRRNYDVCQASLGWVPGAARSTSSNTTPAHTPGRLRQPALCGPGARKRSAISSGCGTSSSASWSRWSGRSGAGDVSGGKRCSKALTASSSGES